MLWKYDCVKLFVGFVVMEWGNWFEDVVCDIYKWLYEMDV